jgi:hypothetical protein
MAIVDVDNRAVPLFPPGLGRPVLLWNLSLTQTAYISSARPVTADSDSIPPLGSLTVDGEQQLFASSLDPAVLIPVQVTEGGLSAMASPAQAADQLSLLGLMKDTTGQNIHTTLGAPSQDSTVQAQLTQGVPPAVQNAAGYARVNADETGSPYTFHTFAAGSRLWGVHLSLAIYKNSAAVSPTQAYGTVKTGSGLFLTVAEAAISGPNTSDSDNSDLTFPGIAIAAGDTLILDINGGVGVSNGGIRASCLVIASTP